MPCSPVQEGTISAPVASYRSPWSAAGKRPSGSPLVSPDFLQKHKAGRAVTRCYSAGSDRSGKAGTVKLPPMREVFYEGDPSHGHHGRDLGCWSREGRIPKVNSGRAGSPLTPSTQCGRSHATDTHSVPGSPTSRTPCTGRATRMKTLWSSAGHQLEELVDGHDSDRKSSARSQTPGRHSQSGVMSPDLSHCQNSSLLSRRSAAGLVPGPTPSRPRRISTTIKREIRMLLAEERIYDMFWWDEVIQEDGNGGKVVVCHERSPDGSPANDREFIMKIKAKDSLARALADQYRRGMIRMLNLEPHPGLMPLHEVLEDENFYYVVMEKASGGPFFENLLKKFSDGVVPADAVRRMMREILEAVSHLHRNGMLHRDIKPDNLVMHSRSGTRITPGSRRSSRSSSSSSICSREGERVTLVDFDHADVNFEHDLGSCMFGTFRFNAPETFKGLFSEQSDLYSVGSTLYLLMAGKLLHDDSLFRSGLDRTARFVHDKNDWRDVIYRRMQAARIDWECNPWPQQTLCRNFCKRLLAFEPSQRPASAEEALKDPWFGSAFDDGVESDLIS